MITYSGSLWTNMATRHAKQFLSDGYNDSYIYIERERYDLTHRDISVLQKYPFQHHQWPLHSNFRGICMGEYSENTWAVGIAQLTHCGPSGELIAQYRPPMSFCFYPTLYLGNHLYFFKPDSSWKQQKNTLISEIDSVHSTKRVVMVTPQHLLVTS